MQSLPDSSSLLTEHAQSLQARGGLIWRPRWLFLILAVIYLAGITNHSFWAENEAYYALGARSVLKGDWLLPVIYNEMAADKPPLVFWAVASVSWVLGGVSEFSARLANVLAALASLVLVYRFVAIRIRNADLAATAVVILATTREFFQIGTEVNTDTFLVALLILAWTAIYDIMSEGFTWRRWLTLWGAIGVGMLVKGPVAAALSGLVAVSFGFAHYGLRDGWKRVWRLRPLIGVPLCVIPFALWCFLVWRAHGAAPLEVILLKHNMQRFVQAFDHKQAWYYYFIKLPILFLPWTILLPLLAWHWWKRKGGSTPVQAWESFSWCAIAVTFIFFSLSSSKRQYYLLPLVPWLALLLAGAITSITHGETRFSSSLRHVVRFAVPLAVALLGIYFVAAYPLLDARRSPYALVHLVERSVDEDERLLIFAEEDPRLIYYLDEKFAYVGETPDAASKVRTLLSLGTATDVLLPRRSLPLMKEMADVPLYVEGQSSYRNNQYYVLTTESAPARPELTDAFIESQSGRAKRRGAAAK